jgi:hypothetical protein
MDVRRHILYILGRIKSPEATAYLITALHRSNEPKAQRTAARALATAGGREAVPELGRFLRQTDDPRLRRAVVEALGRIQAENALPYLCQAIVKDPSKEVRAAAATAIQDLPLAWKDKTRRILGVVEASGISRSRLDTEQLLKAVTPSAEANDGPFAITDYIISKAVEGTKEKDSRTLAILAELIVGSVERDMELAGERLNVFQRAHDLTDETLQSLRIQIGGETALNPILQALERNLRINFQEPINKLNRATQEQWRRTVWYSQIGFVVRMAMSVCVFAAGLALLWFSGKNLLYGDLRPERLWGTGVSFVSALGTILLLIYTGPLKDIRRSMIDLGAASAAFIAYVHRVLQVSHTFSAYYLQRKMTFAESEKSSDLIAHAMRDTIEMLESQETKAAEAKESLSHAA